MQNIYIGNLDNEYMCGAIRFNTYEPTTGLSSGQICDKIDKCDRGWFRRLHDLCSDLDCKYNTKKIDNVVGYAGVLSFAIVCGIGWILSSGVALGASFQPNKMLGIVAGLMFAIFYFVFIGLFTTVWIYVRRVRTKCSYYNGNCKKKMRRSSVEFLAYSICAFVMILLSIVFCFAGAMSADDSDGLKKGDGEEQNYQGIPGAASAERIENDAYGQVKNPSHDSIPVPSNQAQGDQYIAARQQEPDVTGTKKGGASKYSGDEYKSKLRQLHKYINDPVKMQKYADKKFDDVDKDHSGTLTVDEFKDFVSGMLTKKNLPPPSDRKIEAMMRYYDKDKSGTLEKYEFEKMLHEIFSDSREILVKKYAVNKADSWKNEKTPHNPDTSELNRLDAMLENSIDLYKEVDNIAKTKSYQRDAIMDIDEVAKLVELVSVRYKVPSLTKDEIEEVMSDIERPVTDFNQNDQNLAIYASLCISRNLME